MIQPKSGPSGSQAGQFFGLPAAHIPHPSQPQLQPDEHPPVFLSLRSFPIISITDNRSTEATMMLPMLAISHCAIFQILAFCIQDTLTSVSRVVASL